MTHPSRRAVLVGIPASVALASTLQAGSAEAEEPLFADSHVPAQEPLPAEEPLFYGGFRVVRRSPGTPGSPTLTFPSGYSQVEGTQYAVASRAEFYTWVQGPRSDRGIEVEVRWPGVPVEAVVWQESRLPLRRVPGESFAWRCTLPVTYASPGATQATIQVWSQIPTVQGIGWIVEHNDPDRAAGWWAQNPWPTEQVRSVIHQLFAAEAILRDSGLAQTAAGKGHLWSVMGFETNNTLHLDNPPHWHLAYYAGPDTSAPAYLPHLWLDEAGRNFYNGMDVTGHGRSKFYVGDPAQLEDFAGNVVMTMTIRADGGLDIDPPGGPRYSMTAGREGDLLREVGVERAGKRWLRISTNDGVRAGVLVATIVDLERPGSSRTRTYPYDRLTGILR